MNVIIITQEDDFNLFDLEKYREKYPNINFVLSTDFIESNKEDLIIFMKECDFSKIKGKKTLFLEKEIETQEMFFIKSFASKEININKISLLIDIFLD